MYVCIKTFTIGQSQKRIFVDRQGKMTIVAYWYVEIDGNENFDQI